ncbi:12090_t:CDS:2, partial [Cetraspora pellucida]
KVESTQQFESINSILKKHLDQRILLKKLVRVVKSELDKEVQYSLLNNYYDSNLSIRLPSTYNTVFKDINSVLKEYLAPIPLSLQRAQMKQALLYQRSLTTMNKVLLQSEKAVFHIGSIYQYWFKSIPSEIPSYIMIAKGIKTYTTQSLNYIDQTQRYNVYISTIHNKVDKKIKFGNTMSVVKTSIQLNVKISESFNLKNNKLYHLVSYISYNLLEITNPEYHKPKDHPPKCYKSSIEKNNHQSLLSSSKTCNNCQEKEHNIRGCKKQKNDSVNKENNEY